MDYNDNEFQSQNLQLAGEGSTKFPPVLRPYALPKFDFDDSLHGHLRFDGLVETEVFLGIESNEDNQWIEDFSRESSGIEFRTSAAESCSISRHNNVWSEATSSESVEMLLKSVGLEDNIPGKSIIGELDACDELGCLIKQMEQGSKHDDNSLSKVGDVTDVQPALSQNEILGDFAGLKDAGGHPPVAVILQKNVCESSVDGGFSDAIPDAISGKGSLPLTKENNVVDGMKVDTLVESPNGKTEEDSSASGSQFDSVVTSAQNTNASSDELNRQGASHEKTEVSENVDAQQTEIGEHGEESHFVREAEMNDQNLDRNVTDSGVPHSGNPLCLAPGTKSTEEGNAFENTSGFAEEPSDRMRKGESELHIVEGSNEDVHAGNSENQILLISDTSKVNFQETPSVALDNDKVSKGEGEGDKSSSSYAGISTSNVACSAAELLSETQVNLTSKDINDDSGVFREDSNAEVNVSSCILGDSSKRHEENVVLEQVDIQKSDEDLSVDVKESKEFPPDSSNVDHKVGGCIVETEVASSSLSEVGTTDELIISKSHPDTTAGNESAFQNVNLVSHDATEVAVMAPTNVVAENADLIHKEAQMVEACNEGSHSNPQVVPNQVGQEGTEEMEVFPVSDSTRREVDGAEAQVSEKSEEATMKENKEKKSSEVSDAEPIPKSSEMLTQPLSLSSEEVLSDAVQKGQEENEAISVSGDKNCAKIGVPCIDGEVLRVHDGSVSSTSLSESDAKCHSLEGGTNDPANPTCGSPTVIRAARASQSDSEKKGVKASTDQSIPVSEDLDGSANKLCSVTPDSKGIDASKDEKTFTFKVSSLADSSEREGGNNWQHVSTRQASTVLAIVEVSPSTSGGSQLKPTPARDVSRGGLKVSDKETARSGSKVTSERKTRRASSKGTRKDAAKKGNSVKDNTSVRQSEKGDKASNVALSPSGISQLVQSNEMQQYGHVEGSGIKPFNVLTASVSGLPDLNTSSSTLFHQPFTDLQQVQLRAQIFVYGALIQGTAPDEAYMISAFGGPDGGRNIWETAWRACMDRIHGQKPLLPNAETPLQSRSGARALDQAIKHVASQGKVASSPIGRASSKGTPSPIINPIIPVSSPLWNIPTPSVDALQSSGMPRSAVMDYQPALSPLHPQQTPSIRNFVGHNSSWMSQAPFRGTWVAPPQTSAFEGGARFPVLPITETHLIPAKEPSVPHSSAVKHVSSGPMIHSISAATVFPGTSPMLDTRKVTLSRGQQSTEPKSRKRKKTPVSADIGQVMVHSQPQKEPVSAPVVTSHISTSVAITTPASFVSKASTEKVIMPVSPSTSTGHRKKGDRETLQRATLSEETLTKLKEARTQAEDAAAFAAAAVSQSQEIWNQVEKQKNSGLVPDVESKLASAAVAIAAAAAVAKAAAAAANVASSAAVQAKLMADEALDPSVCGSSSQSNMTSLYDSVKDLGKATPASILKGENVKSGPSSVIFAAREAARRKLEAASAASKRAENMDAIVKAAELVAEAVSQAGKIVAMGDPLPLSELLEAGLEGGWKVPQSSTQLVANSKDVNREMNLVNAGEGPDTSVKHSKEVPLDNRETQTTNQRKSPTLREISGELFDDHARLIDGLPGSAATSTKNTKGHKGSKASDLAKTIGVVPESEIGSRSSSISIELECEKDVEPSKENSIKEGSRVEVFREGKQLKAGWFTADVLSLKDGMAYVCYTELPSEEGSEKLKEWVVLKGEGDKAPKIRIARPITAMPFEGTRKRRRAAMGEYTWSVGDRVDAWMGDSWREGVVTEKSKKDETMYIVHFQVQGETTTLRAWNLRPSLMWRDGEWVEWSSSTEQNHTSNEGGDTPQEKRMRLGNTAAEAKMSKGIGTGESRKSDEPTLLDLSATEKVFNIGKNTRDEKKPDSLRMIRTGLQKEGSRVVFGVPKPGKKRKFMEVSKHYVVDQASKINEPNDSVKFARYLMPQAQGSGSRGWKNASRNEPKEKRAAVSKPKVLKSGKPPPSVSGRSLPQKENFVGSSVSAPNDSDADHIAKIKDSTRHVDDSSGKHDVMEFQPFSTSEGAAEGPSLFSTMPLSSDAPSKKVSGPNTKTERVTKGKLAPAGGKLTKIEDGKVFNSHSAKSTSDAVEPRRSNRRIQPTSRLLEGLQSSLIIAKIPSVSHDKNHKNQSRSVSRGNNNG